MSQPRSIRVTSGSAGSSAAAAAGMAVGAAAVAIAAVGVATVVGTREVVLTCAAGASALGAAVATELRRDEALRRATLKGGAAQLRRLPLNFRDQAAAAFGAALQERYGQVGRAGTLRLADGGDLPLEYVALGSNGAFLFGLSRTTEGGMEAFTAGEAGERALHEAAMDAVARLAAQVLGAQGYTRTVDRARRRIVFHRGRGTRRESVVLWYDAVMGTLRIDTRAYTAEGRLFKGRDCPAIDGLLSFFRDPGRPEEFADDEESLLSPDDGGGTARRQDAATDQRRAR